MAVGKLRMPPQTVAVLAVMVEEPDQAHYGLAIARSTGVKTGTLHPILARLQDAGWLSSSWEDPADHEDPGRPPSRLPPPDQGRRGAGAPRCRRGELIRRRGRPAPEDGPVKRERRAAA